MLREEIYQEVERRYGVLPEHLWARNPSCAVLRHPVSKKWFAAVMDVDAKKLGLREEGVYLVVNVKCTPETVDTFLGVEGFLPA